MTISNQIIENVERKQYVSHPTTEVSAQKNTEELTGGVVVDAVEFGEAGQPGDGAWRGRWPAQQFVPHSLAQRGG